MYARMTTVTAPDGDLSRWRRVITEEVSPNAARNDGFVRGFWLLDAGVGISLTLWESREALDAAEASAAQNRGKLAAATGGTVETRRCEVIAEA